MNDYRINLFEIAYLTQEQVALFQSDFRIVADYFVQKREKGGIHNMCDVLDRIELKGRREGRQEGRQEGRREGRQEGITQGHQEERVKNARAMKSKGFQPDIISEITGLPISEIAGL